MQKYCPTKLLSDLFHPNVCVIRESSVAADVTPSIPSHQVCDNATQPDWILKPEQLIITASRNRKLTMPAATRNGAWRHIALIMSREGLICTSLCTLAIS